jgi:hypothetical protein
MAVQEERKNAFARRFLGHKEIRELISNLVSEKERSSFDGMLKLRADAESEQAQQEIANILSSSTAASAPYEALLGVKKRAETSGMFVFSDALTNAFKRILGEAELKKSYLSGAASAGECLKFYQKVDLSNDIKQRLNELEAEKKHLERDRTIEACIFEGSAGQDKQYTQTMSDLLRGKPVAETGEALDEAVRRALSSPDSRRTLFRRFVSQTKGVYDNGQVRRYINESEPLLNSIFRNLKHETRLDFLKKLWVANKDEPGLANPVNASSQEVFNKLMEHKDNAGKTKRKKKSKAKAKPKPFTLSPVEESLLSFLGSNSELRRQVARWELGSGETERIDEYLSDYLAPDAREERDDATSNDEAEVGGLKKFWSGSKHVLSGLLKGGKKSDADQEDED